MVRFVVNVKDGSNVRTDGFSVQYPIITEATLANLGHKVGIKVVSKLSPLLDYLISKPKK